MRIELGRCTPVNDRRKAKEEPLITFWREEDESVIPQNDSYGHSTEIILQNVAHYREQLNAANIVCKQLNEMQ